jgi:hypothetical protein
MAAIQLQSGCIQLASQSGLEYRSVLRGSGWPLAEWTKDAYPEPGITAVCQPTVIEPHGENLQLSI